MRIIDLIILMYHKEMPYKIMYEGEEYVYNKEFEEYVCCNHDLTPLFSKYNWYGLTILDDAVEIIEEKEDKEEKKIPEKLPKSVTDNAGSSKDMRLIATTINQLIDYIKSKGDE